MFELFFKTFSSFVDKNLSALLLGAAAMLLLLFQYWKVPEKWDDYNDKLEIIENRLRRIEERQRRIFDWFKLSASRVGNRVVTIEELEPDSGEFENPE